MGEIYRFLSKPWTFEEIEQLLATAFELHNKQIEDASLLSQAIEELKRRFSRIASMMSALSPRDSAITSTMRSARSRSSSSSSRAQRRLERLLARVSPEHPRAHLRVARTLKDLERASVPVSPKHYEWLDLEAIFEKTLVGSEFLRHEKRQRIVKHVPYPLPAIRGEPEQIEKLFRFMLAEEVVSLPPDTLVNVRFQAHEADGEVLGVQIEFEDNAPSRPISSPPACSTRSTCVVRTRATSGYS